MMEKIKNALLSKEYLEADEATKKIMWLNLFVMLFIVFGWMAIVWHKLDLCGIGESHEDDYDFEEDFD